MVHAKSAVFRALAGVLERWLCLPLTKLHRSSGQEFSEAADDTDDDNDAQDSLPVDAEEGEGAGGGTNDEENGDDNLLDEEVDVEEDCEGDDGDEDEDDGGRKHFVAAHDDAIKS